MLNSLKITVHSQLESILKYTVAQGDKGRQRLRLAKGDKMPHNLKRLSFIGQKATLKCC